MPCPRKRFNIKSLLLSSLTSVRFSFHFTFLWWNRSRESTILSFLFMLFQCFCLCACYSCIGRKFQCKAVLMWASCDVSEKRNWVRFTGQESNVTCSAKCLFFFSLSIYSWGCLCIIQDCSCWLQSSGTESTFIHNSLSDHAGDGSPGILHCRVWQENRTGQKAPGWDTGRDQCWSVCKGIGPSLKIGSESLSGSTSALFLWHQWYWGVRLPRESGDSSHPPQMAALAILKSKLKEHLGL